MECEMYNINCVVYTRIVNGQTITFLVFAS